MRFLWILLGISALAIAVAFGLDLSSRDKRFDSKFALQLAEKCAGSAMENCTFSEGWSREKSRGFSFEFSRAPVSAVDRGGLKEYSFSSEDGKYCSHVQIKPLAIYQYRYFVTLYLCSEEGKTGIGLG